MGKVNEFVLPHKKSGQTSDLLKQYELYQKLKAEKIEQMSEGKLRSHVVSEANWLIRSQHYSCADLGVLMRVGDICFIDFGEAYLLESGYQHFAFVLNVMNGKAFVIPMTSNPEVYEAAYDSKENPNGKRHLMRIGMVEGMNRKSTLFLNDAKFINSARVIDVKAHISVNSKLFMQIKERVIETISFQFNNY